MLFGLVPAYIGIHPPEDTAPHAENTSLHLWPLCLPSAGIKHDINQLVLHVQIETAMVTHTTIPTLNFGARATIVKVKILTISYIITFKIISMKRLKYLISIIHEYHLIEINFNSMRIMKL